MFWMRNLKRMALGLCALVIDGQECHALAAVRSLGNHGVKVTVASPKRDAMSFYSRHCSKRLMSPSPAREPRAYADWLLETLYHNHQDALLCFGESSLHVLASIRDEVQALTGCRMPPHSVLFDADRKDFVARRAKELGIDVPRTVEPENLDRVASLAHELEMPVIVKGVLGSGGRQVEMVREPDKLVDAVRRVAALNIDPDLPLPIMQEYIPGSGYGVSALMQHGEPLAVFAHRRLEEHDVGRGTGLAHAATGAESVDEPVLVDAGLRLLRALRWDGMAMVEFRRSSRNGRFYIIEVNPRFVGSLDLAIAAGVDFPWLYTRMAAGLPVEVPEAYQVGLRYRWLVSKNIAQVFESPGGFARAAFSLLRLDTATDINLLDPKPHFSHLRAAAWWVRQNHHSKSHPAMVPFSVSTEPRSNGTDPDASSAGELCADVDAESTLERNSS